MTDTFLEQAVLARPLARDRDGGLVDVVLRLRRANELLASADGRTPDEALTLLGEVEDLLAGLGCEAEFGGHGAQRLFGLRDELSGHLLAAASLAAIDLPGDAHNVLCRVVLTLMDGITAIWRDEHRILAQR